MADYQLTAAESSVIRTADNACIPNDPANRDWMDYQTWLDQGHIPDPYVEPPAPEPAVPSAEDEVLFDHENRIRAIEGQPPLSLGDFTKKLKP